MSSFLWIVFDLVYEKKAGGLSLKQTLIYAGAYGFLISLMIAGFRGFSLQGGSTLFNYFIIAFMLGGALQHRFWERKFVGS